MYLITDTHESIPNKVPIEKDIIAKAILQLMVEFNPYNYVVHCLDKQ